MSQTLQFIYLVISECFYGDNENATCMRGPGRHDRVVRSEPFPLGKVPNSMVLLEEESSPLPDDYYDRAEEIVDAANADAADNSAEVAELKARIAELEAENADLLATVDELNAELGGEGNAKAPTDDAGSVESSPSALPFDDVPEDERTPQMKRARTIAMNKAAE